jgi:hypothetical protein
MMLTDYYMDFKNYTANNYVNSQCNAITFENRSSTIVELLINSVFLVASGQSITFQGNENEYDTTKYNFQLIPGIPGVTGTCSVTRKINRMKGLQPYVNDFKSYTKSQYVDSKCNAIGFFCFLGTPAQAIINDVASIGFGQNFTVNGNYGEIDTTQYKLTIPNGAGGHVVVVRKIYL